MGQNRLALEKSPYLRQHADNPVDWYPWGEEAFAKARAEDKPVFLSIGYSTCHWCHVMEHESFEDAEVAALMNRAFVCVKVDREERPDVDHIYMTVCQMMTGGGGWPLTLLLTPDRRPFFAATYIPKPSMLAFIPRVESAWREQRDSILTDSERVTRALESAVSAERGGQLAADVLHDGYRGFLASFDSTYGGFGARPKFPSPHNHIFLLRYWKRTQDANALAMVEKSLERMRRGGIFDQVGFGFHRYSTDATWLLPHFEKMLYDQALLLMAYTEAYHATRKETYRATALEIAQYVMRDLSSPEGGFYSAEDADSEGEEGKFYVWTRSELETVLGGDAALAASVFGVEDAGNFAEEASGHRSGANVLHLPRPLSEAASASRMDEGALRARMDAVRERLLEARAQRVRPHLDDKILTDWNGLMIAALARAGRLLEQPELIKRAREAAAFVEAKLTRRGGALVHRYRDGDAAIDGMLDDYAFFAWGLLELYEATFDVAYLERAVELTKHMDDRFADRNGGYFMTTKDTDDVIVRPKEIHDGAVPSGNSVAMLNLARIARFTGEMKWDQKARAVGESFAAQVAQIPMAHAFVMTALDFILGPTFEVVVSGKAGAPDTRRMLSALDHPYVPNKVMVLRPSDDPDDLVELVPYARDQVPVGSAATAYICRNFACDLPTTDPSEAAAKLAGDGAKSR
ncbi:MAG TPA: thioredoxin domain-containing protein [Candidatus Krumholzibacteria bacterium]|nr:thioredoxin domain-containing protein [Candidatus Krumholzibacteria bacterium]